MNNLTVSPWIASVFLHALVLAPLVSFAGSGTRDVYDDGAAQDAFRLEQGLSIEMVSIGDSAEQVQIAEVTKCSPRDLHEIEQPPCVRPDFTFDVTLVRSLRQI